MPKTAVKSKAKASSSVKISKKMIYFFGGGKADGKESMKLTALEYAFMLDLEGIKE